MQAHRLGADASLGRGLHPRGASARERQIQGTARRGLLRRRTRRPDDLVLDAAPAGAVVGERYRLEARATSGLAVAVSSLTPAVCTLAGPNVRTIGAGSCTIEADQAGNDAFEPAAPVQLVFEVLEPDPGPRSQTVAFTSTAPSGALVGGAAYLVSATASSGLTVDLSVDAASAGVCAITGNRVTFSGEGTCTVGAEQSGGHGFLVAPPVSQSFLVARAPQAVSFLSTPPASAVAGLTTYLVVAVVLRKPPGHAVRRPVERCRLRDLRSDRHRDLGGDVRGRRGPAGRHHLQACVSGGQTFSVGSATPSLSVQSINFTSTPPAAAIVGGPGYALAATATSGLPVAFSAAASSAGICTVTGSTVALLGAGTCTIVADQSGSTAYAAAAQVQQSSPSPSRRRHHLHLRSPGSRCGRRYRLHHRGRRILRVDADVQPRSCEQRYLLVTGAAVSLLSDGTCTIFATSLAMRRTRPQAGSPRASRSVPVRRARARRRSASPPRRRPPRRPAASYTPAASASSGPADHRSPSPRRAPASASSPAVSCPSSGPAPAGCSPTRPATQLRPSASGVPVLQRLTATARPPDDRLHVGRADCGRLWRRAVRRRGNRELRAARRLLDSGIEQRHLHGLRLHGLARRRRYLHDLRESGG